MSSLSRRTPFALALLASGAFVVTPSPAVASDETLKAGIEEVLINARPALEEFESAAQALPKAKSTARLEKATLGFRFVLRQYKWGVINRKASSDEGLAAKKQLLTAIREYDIGLVEYTKAIEKLDQKGAKRASILSSLRTADKRFTAAVEDETAALKVFKVSE